MVASSSALAPSTEVRECKRYLTQIGEADGVIESLAHTFDHARVVIGGVRPDQHDNETPCEEWTVHDLLEHVIGVVASLGAAAAGTPPTSGSAFALGADPAAQFEDAAASALSAWRTPGVLDSVVDAGAGPMPGRVLAGINLLDTATHTWDLATATGQAATLPDDIAEAALEASLGTIAPETRAGRFGPEVAAPPDARPTERLVAFLGRTP